MNYVSRCEPVYNKMSDTLPNNYKVSPDSGVYTLRVIAPHTFINTQSSSYVTFKKTLIFLFLGSVNDASFNALFMKNE